MKRLWIAAVLLTIGFASETWGGSATHLITPNAPRQYGFEFAVHTKAVKEGTACKITATSELGRFSSDPGAKSGWKLEAASGLTVLKRTVTKMGVAESGEETDPKVQVTLHKEARTWTAEFVLPHELLKTRGLCYYFWIEYYFTEYGRRTPWPALDMFAVSLDEFLNVPNETVQRTGASGSAHETNQAPVAAGSGR